MNKPPSLVVLQGGPAPDETAMQAALRLHMQAAQSAERIAADALMMTRDAAHALTQAAGFPSLAEPYADRLKRLGAHITAELQSIEAQRLKSSQ